MFWKKKIFRAKSRIVSSDKYNRSIPNRFLGQKTINCYAQLTLSAFLSLWSRSHGNIKQGPLCHIITNDGVQDYRRIQLYHDNINKTRTDRQPCLETILPFIERKQTTTPSMYRVWRQNITVFVFLNHQFVIKSLDGAINPT